jgi:uncharacterized delta-60 repeat protein
MSKSMKTIKLNEMLVAVVGLALQLSALGFRAYGAAGDVDLSFNASLGITGAVQVVAVQPDGKVLAGGAGTFVNGTNSYAMLRLNTNGSTDETFAPADFYPAVGDLGVTYDPGVYYFTHSFTAFAVQPNGKVVVAGVATLWGSEDDLGYLYRGDLCFVTRHHADGSLDASFTPALGNLLYGGGEIVRALAVEASGKILIGGYFHAINGTNRNGIARLNANGTLDTSSSLNLSSNYLFTVTALASQPDGKFFLEGQRLNSDGSPDASFSGVAGVSSVVLQPDGKVLIGGNFTTVHGTNRNRIARLNANGTLDAGFDPGAGANAMVRSIALQTNGGLIIAGDFTTVNEANRNRIARLNANGGLDASFNPEPAVSSPPEMLALQPDGKVLIGGPLVTGEPWFGPASDWPAFVNGTLFNGRMRLNPDGRVDRAFASAPFNPPLSAMYHLEDCIGDPRYGCLQGAVGTTLVSQPDSKVLIGGYSVSTITGDETLVQIFHPFVARFGIAGGLETRFDQLTNAYEINALALQPGGKILVGGWFYRPGSDYGVARLNGDGSVDEAFKAGTAVVNGIVYSMALQSDGKVLIGGNFTMVGGTNRQSIARLNASGSLDTTFNPGTGANGAVRAIKLQPDGKLLIGGAFNAFNGTNRSCIARLNPNGSLDLGFNPGIGADGVVSSIALQPDGNVLIGGDFNTINGVERRYVARLYGDYRPLLTLSQLNASAVLSWSVSAPDFKLQESTNLALANAWLPVARSPITNGAQISVTMPAAGERKFFRLWKE